MADKRKGRSLNAIYCKPLPVTLSVDLYGQLPVTTLANPVSWLWMLYQMGKMYLSTPAHQLDRKYEVHIVAMQPEPVFQIQDPDDMIGLWQQGFFGKGTLSRSDPTWRHRARNLETGYLPKEDMTQARRGDRRTFKSLRSQVQQLEAMARQRQLSPAESEHLSQLQKQMEEAKTGREERTAPTPKQAIACSNAADLESLQLQKVELFFLAYALDVVSVSHAQRVLTLDETFRECMQHEMRPDNRFLIEYVAYHHFRSLGWCVRSGIKFGCHMLLYKRGPPFSHAEFAVLVVPNNGQEWTTWEDFMAIARVVTSVKKTLVLVYVDTPATDRFLELAQAPLDPPAMKRLLQSYKVTEVVYRRWSPSRTRD